MIGYLLLLGKIKNWPRMEASGCVKPVFYDCRFDASAFELLIKKRSFG